MANQQSKAEIIKFATQLCLACSVLVSTAAVVLRPLQDANVENEKKINSITDFCLFFYWNFKGIYNLW